MPTETKAPETAATQKPATFEQLLGLEVDTLTETLTGHYKTAGKLKTDRTQLRSDTPRIGKITAAMKAKFVQLQEARVYSRGMAFDEFHEKVTGHKPGGGEQSCANVFNSIVLGSALLPETDYDSVGIEALTKTSSIINLAIAKYKVDWPKAPEIAETVGLLKSRPDGYQKTLREIRQRLKGDTLVKSEGQTITYSLATLLAMLDAACQEGHQCEVMARIIAEIHHGKEIPGAVARGLFGQGYLMTDAWEKSGLEPALLDEWATELDRSRKADADAAKARAEAEAAAKPADPVPA